MIKQSNYANQIAIGGTKEEVEPLFTALYNWQGTDATDLLSLGSDEFFYFLIQEDKYIDARAKAFCMNWQNYWKKEELNSVGGAWALAKDKARKELDGITEERFLLANPYDISYTLHETESNRIEE